MPFFEFLCSLESLSTTSVRRHRSMTSRSSIKFDTISPHYTSSSKLSRPNYPPIYRKTPCSQKQFASERSKDTSRVHPRTPAAHQFRSQVYDYNMPLGQFEDRVVLEQMMASLLSSNELTKPLLQQMFATMAPEQVYTNVRPTDDQAATDRAIKMMQDRLVKLHGGPKIWTLYSCFSDAVFGEFFHISTK